MIKFGMTEEEKMKENILDRFNSGLKINDALPLFKYMKADYFFNMLQNHCCPR